METAGIDQTCSHIRNLYVTTLTFLTTPAKSMMKIIIDMRVNTSNDSIRKNHFTSTYWALTRAQIISEYAKIV